MAVSPAWWGAPASVRSGGRASWELLSAFEGRRDSPLGHPGGDLGAAAKAQLGQDVLDVVLGSPLRDPQTGGDLTVAVAGRDQLRHAALAGRQRPNVPGLWAGVAERIPNCLLKRHAGSVSPCLSCQLPAR